MKSTLSSVADFDATLSVEFMRHRQLMPDKSEAFIQQRFAQYAIFPEPGWSLLGAGEREAISNRDPAPLHGAITRFVRCAHHCWGHADESGLHFGGMDHCAMVVPALYSAAIGRSYTRSSFHSQRPLSKVGYGATVHAANLMTGIECPAWPFKEKAIARAKSFASSSSRSVADRAFIEFMLGVAAGDAAAAGAALGSFADAYLKSDWGRHKPWTKSVFIQSMLAYAAGHLSGPVQLGAHHAFLSEEQVWVWAAMRQALDALEGQWSGFPEPLSFLNPLPSSA